LKVILQEDVVGLGEEGDVRDVAPGYARNFLIRRKAALPYSTQAAAMLEQRRDAIEKRKTQKRQSAASVRDRIEAEVITIAMTAGDSGKLFGSVTNAAVAAELEKRGYDIDRRRIEVPDHSLKTVGEHEVRLRLYEDESATLKVVITADGAE
jgi:large subunit ribosomal protein L9